MQPELPPLGFGIGPVVILHRLASRQTSAQRRHQSRQIVWMHQLLQHPRQLEALVFLAADAAVAWAHIDDLQMLVTQLQQRHTVVHIFQKLHQRDCIHRSKRRKMPILEAILLIIFQTERVLARLLRTVKRQIRRLIQRFKGLLPLRQIHAHTRRQIHQPARAQRQLQAFADRRRFLAHQLLADPPADKDRKLIAAEPPHNVARPEDLREDLRRLADRRIACLMTQRVVHQLEIVQVHDKKRAALLRRHFLQTPFDKTLHRRAI